MKYPVQAGVFGEGKTRGMRFCRWVCNEPVSVPHSSDIAVNFSVEISSNLIGSAAMTDEQAKEFCETGSFFLAELLRWQQTTRNFEADEEYIQLADQASLILRDLLFQTHDRFCGEGD